MRDVVTRSDNDRTPRWRRRAWRVLTAAVAALLAACSGAQSEGPLPRPQADVATPARYAAALRLAAVARVEARAGSDEMAAEHFRAAYRQFADATFLVAYAQSAERAKLHAEAYDALRRALDHSLSDEERLAVGREVERLRALVPPGLVRVAIQVEPAGTRVELSRAQADGPGSPAAAERIVLGSGIVFLPAGPWTAYSVAKGYQSELRTLHVQPDGGDWLAIALASEDAAPPLGGAPAPTAVAASIAVQPAAATARPAAPKEAPRVAVPPAESKVQAEAKTSAAPPRPVESSRAPVRPAQPTSPTLAPAATATAAAAPPPRKGPSAVHKWGPIATSALGVLALGAGGLFGMQAIANADAANGLRDQGLSKADYTSQFAFYREATVSDAAMANTAWISGGVLLAAGTVWWLLAPKRPALTMATLPAALPVASQSPAGTAPIWPLTPWQGSAPTLRPGSSGALPGH